METDLLIAWTLWCAAAVVLVLAGVCFARHWWTVLTALVPVFLAVLVVDGLYAARAAGHWTPLVLAVLGAGFVLTACLLFLVDRRWGLWAFDMTYAAVVCWLVAPAVIAALAVTNLLASR